MFAYTHLIFHYLPRRILNQVPRTGRDKAIERLRTLARFPSILGASEKRTVYYFMGSELVLARRYADAIAPLQTALDLGLGRETPSIHGRLADALEGLGRMEEAEEERRKALTTADDVGMELTVAMARGKDADRTGRPEEAAGYYREVLEQTNSPSLIRLYRLKLTLAYMKAGDPEQTIYWAEQGINDPTEPVDRHCAYRRLAGYACMTLGWYEDAATYLQASYEDAERAGNHEAAEQTLAGLITLQHSLGHLQEAINLAGGTWPSTGLETRPARAALSQCLLDMGRFEQARAAMLESLGDKPYPIPKTDRGSRHAQLVGLALVDIAEGNIETAADLIEELLGENHGPKMRLYIQSIWAFLLAETLRIKPATDIMDAIDAEFAAKTPGPTTLRDCYHHLTRAALSTRDFRRAIHYCELRLAVPPHPVGMPSTYCLLGEAYAGLGDVDKAEGAYRQGLSYGIETIWTNRIRRHLEDA